MSIFQYITNKGIVVADTSTTKAEVQAEYLKAFGPNLVLADESPQGRLIDVEVTARDGVLRLAAEQSNQINPQYSSGNFLASVCSLHDVAATVATYTVLPSVLLTGLAGTIVPVGSRIADSNGTMFSTVSQVTLTGGEVATATVDCLADKPGSINPASNSVTIIVDGTYGWLSVTNPTATIPGRSGDLNNDNALRAARRNKLSKLAKGPVEAIASNVYEVPGVRSLSIRENYTAGTLVEDGVTMSPSSTWVCVQGGLDSTIALALIKSKQSGSPWTIGVNNGTPVLLMMTDPISGQVYPVAFTRNIKVPIGVKVTVSRSAIADPNTAIPDAILTYANGNLAGEPGFVVGADVSPFEIASAINVQYPEFFIKKVEIGTLASGPVYSTNPIAIALWENADVASGSIIVEII